MLHSMPKPRRTNSNLSGEKKTCSEFNLWTKLYQTVRGLLPHMDTVEATSWLTNKHTEQEVSHWRAACDLWSIVPMSQD